MTQDKAMEAARRFADATGAEMIAMLGNGTEHYAPQVRAMARAYLSTVSPPAEGEVREVVERLRAKIAHTGGYSGPVDPTLEADILALLTRVRSRQTRLVR